MGVIADLIANSRSFDKTNPRDGVGRIVYRQLQELVRNGDFGYPSGYDVRNEVQSIAVHEAGTDGGTFEITINLKDGTTFTTDPLAHDANAAAIETAIDDAADAAEVAGFTAGDIAVTGGPLTTTPVVLTFSGASVAGLNHPLAENASVDLEDGGVPTDAGAVTVDTEGQTARSGWAALKALSIVTSDPPAQGEDLSGPTIGLARGQFPANLDADTVRVIIAEASLQDENDSVQSVLLAALDL